MCMNEGTWGLYKLIIIHAILLCYNNIPLWSTLCATTRVFLLEVLDDFEMLISIHPLLLYADCWQLDHLVFHGIIGYVGRL